MIAVVLYVVTVVAIVVIALVSVGRETFISAGVARPAVFDLDEAVQFVSDTLDDDAAGQLTPDDVRWILRIDIEQLEVATDHAADLDLGRAVLDEDDAVAAVLARLHKSKRQIRDADVAAVLAGRSLYLEAIGAIGPRAEPV